MGGCHPEWHVADLRNMRMEKSRRHRKWNYQIKEAGAQKGL
jgi:hypothetical protein